MIRELKYSDLEEIGLTRDEIQTTIIKALKIKKVITYVIHDGYNKENVFEAESLKELREILKEWGKDI